MELEQFYRSLPKFTRFYMIAIFATTFIKSYVKLPIIPYLDLDFDLVLTNFHVWRLFTNFFIVGKFSFNFLFFLIMM
jgi:Derlin-2/3